MTASRSSFYIGTPHGHPINDPECWEMFDPLRVRFYELRRHADVWAIVAVISKIGGTAMSEPADMISWADQAIECLHSTLVVAARPNDRLSRCPDSLL